MSEVDREQADRHKHLDHVQTIIARLGNNSFLMKGWSLTVVAALVGYALSKSSTLIALVALLPAGAFWFLDSYYLRQERAFRKMYDAIGEGNVRAFEIRPQRFLSSIPRLRTAASLTLSAFYGTLLAVSVLVAIVVSATDDDRHEHEPPSIRGELVPEGCSGHHSPTRPR